MDNTAHQLSTAEEVLWWLGWRPQFALKMGLGFCIASTILFSSLAGLLFGLTVLAAWIRGVQLINRLWPKYLADAESSFKMAGEQKLGIQTSDREWFVLCAGGGSRRPFLSSAPEYRFDALYVTNTFVGIYASNAYDMQSRTATFGHTAKELDFRHIASVEYTAPILRLVTTSGGPLLYSASEAPEVGNSVLNAVRQKLKVLRPALV